MKGKKLISAITSAAVGISMLLSTGAVQVFASAIDTDAFVPVRYSNQTVTTTASGDAAVTTTAATTEAYATTTTTTTTTVDTNGLEYPVSGEKVVSVSVYDEDTGYNIFGDVDVTARLLTTEDINNDTEGVEIASWNLNEENIQPYALTVPYTIDYEGQMLFVGIHIDNYTDIDYNDIQETLFIFDPLSDDASFEYNVPLDKSYVTTLAPLDYCEGCGKDLAEGEGVRTVLGMYLCSDCVAAGMGGTTTAPTTTTTTTDDIGCVSSLETQTTLAPQDYCDSCGADIPEGEGVRTPLGLYICKDCKNAGAGGTTPPASTDTTTTTTTTVTTLNTTSTPQNKICDGCGYGAFEYNGTYTEDGLFYCYQCAEDILGGTTTATTTTVTTTTPIACYNTLLDYDDSEMAVGETRAIYFFNAYSGVGADPFIGEASENITYTYEEGTNIIYITALAAGEAKLYIREGTCAFGAYVSITVTDDTEDGTSDCIPYEYGDADGDGQVGISDVVMVMCYVSNSEKYPLDDFALEMADVYQQGDGVGASDALAIQKKIAQIIDVLPES